MSSEAMVWAWGPHDLDPPQKLTLLALAEDANHQWQCWPSKNTLARRTSMSEETVAHCLKELDSKGFLQREERVGESARVFLTPQRVETVIQPKAPREIAPFQPSADVAADMEKAVVLWNEMAARTAQGNSKHRLSRCVKLNDAKKRQLKARLEEFGLEGWAFCVSAVEHNAHCRGVNDRGWQADIGYLLQPQGSSNTINGRWKPDYEDKTNAGQRTGPSGRGDQRLDRVRGFDRAIRGRIAGGERREGGGAGDCQDPSAAGGSARQAGARLALGPPADAE